MAEAFDGIRVVELAQWVFVPVAGALLADWGADVIRVDRPEGDPYRGLMTQGIGSGERRASTSRSRWPTAASDRSRSTCAPRTASRCSTACSTPPTCCSPASVPARSSGSDSAPTRSGSATRGSSTPGATATACVAPTPTCRATTRRPSGPGVASATCSPRPSATTRSPSGARSVTATAAWPSPSASPRRCSGGPDRRGVGRRRLAPGDRDVDAVLRHPLGAAGGGAPGPRRSGDGQPAGRHLPDEGRPPHPAGLPRVRPLLGAVLRADRPARPGRRIRASPTTTPGASTRRPASPRSTRCSRPAPSRSGRRCSPGSTRRGRRCRRSRSCSTTPRSLANGYLGEVELDGGGSYRLPRVPVQFDERAPELRRAPEHGEHTEEVLLELGYTWDDIATFGER